MKKLFIFIFLLIFPVVTVQAATLSEQLSGKILLQVEENGEAWYMNPANTQRYFLGRPVDALNIMRELGIGISNNDLDKIPVSLDYKNGVDSDSDGLADSLELALGTNPQLADSDNDTFSDFEEINSGYNPKGENVLIDLNFAKKHKGKIFLQVESNGEAWYISPGDNLRYYLGRPKDAFAVMRSLGLGITNENLDKIIASTAGYTGSSLEMKMFEAINQERVYEDKLPLIWNDELANVAREHSQDLATENEAFVGEGMSCEFPIIHHEGLLFGDYNADRLYNRDVYYYSSAGENIALVPSVSTTVLFSYNDPRQTYFNSCPERRGDMDTSFKSKLDEEEEVEAKKEIIQTELVSRTVEYKKEYPLQIDEQKWHTSVEVVKGTVSGWMNSPGHKANILEEKYDESGIGVATVGGYLISTQVFIKRADCGYKDGTCCVEEGYMPYCYTPMTCEQGLCK